MRMFKYLFYRILNFQKKFGEDTSSAAVSAFLSVALFWGINLFTVLLFFEKDHRLYTQIRDFLPEGALLFPLIFFIPLGILSYLLFFQNKKYLKIIKEIENSKLVQNKLSNFLALGYEILSLLSFILVLVRYFSR